VEKTEQQIVCVKWHSHRWGVKAMQRGSTMHKLFAIVVDILSLGICIIVGGMVTGAFEFPKGSEMQTAIIVLVCFVIWGWWYRRKEKYKKLAAQREWEFQEELRLEREEKGTNLMVEKK
jgi:hypothetical protein